MIFEAKRKLRNLLILGFYFSGLWIPRNMWLKRKYGNISRILCFHWIGSTQVDQFESRLIWLKDRYSVVKLSDMGRHGDVSSDRMRLSITFDDAFDDFCEYLLPIFNKHSIPVTLFVPSDITTLEKDERRLFARKNIGIDKGLLSEAAIKVLAENDLVDIQSHSKTHCDFGAEPYSKLATECIESKERLESITGAVVDRLAYPFGDVANVSLDGFKALDNANYSHAYTIEPGFNHVGTPNYLQHRDSLSPNISFVMLRAWLAGSYDIFKFMQNRRKKRDVDGRSH